MPRSIQPPRAHPEDMLPAREVAGSGGPAPKSPLPGALNHDCHTFSKETKHFETHVESRDTPPRRQIPLVQAPATHHTQARLSGAHCSPEPRPSTLLSLLFCC